MASAPGCGWCAAWVPDQLGVDAMCTTVQDQPEWIYHVKECGGSLCVWGPNAAHSPVLFIWPVWPHRLTPMFEVMFIVG